ncbi:DUF3500 domain-containing protein [Paenarthrobacter nitroguajacolicus]|uniref:DUF3500 domain-containing protein n=1 Tax=Paenarthrobacter nitroguajacolicus TaxID=211146 RepID=UPI00248B5684|nr:DUF3500 domain-containing protein [Paenarthrobacter nitroguajacolicus]
MTTPDSPSLSRRTLLGSLPVFGLFALAACSSPSTSTPTATASTTPAPSSAAASASATASATGSTTAAGTVAQLAQSFQATLGTDLQSQLLQDYSLANAKLWSNLPQALLSGGMGGGPGGGGGSGPRIGLNLADLNESQLSAFNTLLAAATGSAKGLGYDEVQQHLNADEYLGANGGGNDYGRSGYYIAFLGSPADTGTWEFQFGGHHLAVANTYKNGVLAGATPSFRGIEPNSAFDYNGTTNQPMAAKEAAFAALLAGLTTDQQATAKLSKTYSDLLLGPGQDWAFPTTKEGLQVSKLSSEQKKLVLAAIAGYANDIADDDAATILRRYENELDGTYVAYSGTTALTQQNDYIRIDGPSVWIEFSMQRGIVLSGNHPHSLWRDRNTDYGGTKD